jgi:alkylation response protein AidB-like acyl-CoA dehydrogenase
VTDLKPLLADIRARRAEFERAQRVSDDVVEGLRKAGVYRALVARRFGGEEITPRSFLELIESISAADGSVGWVASFGVSAIYLSSLPVDTLAQIYARGPDVIFAGAIFPPQRALTVDGGFEVSGRWKFASGCTGADIVGAGISVDGATPGGGLPRMAVLPIAKAGIEENWNVIGLKGTGSHDLVLDKVMVPEAWTFVRGGPPTLDERLYHYPSMAFAAQVLAVVGLGVAREALDEISAMATERPSITGAPVLAERAYLQIEIAKAEAALRGARAFFYETTDDAWATVKAGDSASKRQTALLRLAASNAARVAADVARMAYTLSGVTGIYADHPLARHATDAMVVVQHAFLAEGTWQSAGRALLGLDCPPGFP